MQYCIIPNKLSSMWTHCCTPGVLVFSKIALVISFLSQILCQTAVFYFLNLLLHRWSSCPFFISIGQSLSIFTRFPFRHSELHSCHFFSFSPRVSQSKTARQSPRIAPTLRRDYLLEYEWKAETILISTERWDKRIVFMMGCITFFRRIPLMPNRMYLLLIYYLICLRHEPCWFQFMPSSQANCHSLMLTRFLTSLNCFSQTCFIYNEFCEIVN